MPTVSTNLGIRYGGDAVIGTYLLPVQDVRGAYHMGIFYSYVSPPSSPGEDAIIVTKRFEAYPTQLPSLPDEIVEGGKEFFFGIPNTNSPFGPISYESKIFQGEDIQLPQGATNVKILNSENYSTDGIADQAISDQATAIENTFVQAKNYAYLPDLQNSNTVAVAALNAAGLQNPYSFPFFTPAPPPSDPLRNPNPPLWYQLPSFDLYSPLRLPGAGGELSTLYTKPIPQLEDMFSPTLPVKPSVPYAPTLDDILTTREALRNPTPMMEGVSGPFGSNGGFSNTTSLYNTGSFQPTGTSGFIPYLPGTQQWFAAVNGGAAAGTLNFAAPGNVFQQSESSLPAFFDPSSVLTPTSTTALFPAVPYASATYYVNQLLSSPTAPVGDTGTPSDNEAGASPPHRFQHRPSAMISATPPSSTPASASHRSFSISPAMASTSSNSRRRTSSSTWRARGSRTSPPGRAPGTGCCSTIRTAPGS
jgi:hypothetical protein